MIKNGLKRGARCALVIVMIAALAAAWVPVPAEAAAMGIAVGTGIAVAVGVPMLLAWLGITEDKTAPEGPSYFSGLVSKATDFLADAGYISAGLLSTSVAISNPGAVTGMSVVPVPMLQKLNEWLFSAGVEVLRDPLSDVADKSVFTSWVWTGADNYCYLTDAMDNITYLAAIHCLYPRCYGPDPEHKNQYCIVGHGNQADIYLIRLGETGDLTAEGEVWSQTPVKFIRKHGDAVPVMSDKPITTGNLCAPGVDVGSISAGGVITAPYPPGAGSDTDDPDNTKPIGWVPVNPNAFGSQEEAQQKVEVDVVPDVIPEPTVGPTNPAVPTTPGGDVVTPGVDVQGGVLGALSQWWAGTWEDIKSYFGAASTDRPATPETDAYKVDLIDFFPFCIPRDIHDFFAVLCAEPVAPVIHWEVPFPGREPITVDLDLSTWDDVAALFRKLQLALFVLGLALITRDKIINS